jgi:hypothetical protein
VRRHARWYAAADQQPYLLGAALRLAEAVAPVVTRSATAGEDLTEEMAAAVSEVERKPRWPLVADGFDFPVAKPDGTGYYVASGLAEEPYFERFKFWHTGEDWNDVRGGDSDLGAPVYTVAHGRVVTARYFRPSWGNVILIEHVLEDGTTVWSQYAHLQDRYVRKGDIVWRGQKIGTIGKGADDRWIAHLHFEIRTRELPASKWGWTTAEDREAVLQHYAHPTEFIKSRRPLQEMVMLTVDDEGTDAFTRSESEHWFSAKAGHDGQTWWTWTVSEEQGEDCVATWQPKLDRSGMYEIYAFIPRNCATTEQARYQITHRRGVDTAVVAQSDYFDEWVSLGAYPLSTEMQAHVRLSDVTGEPYTRDEGQRKQIAFDATLWILVEADV